jgi:alkylation response protein AidB-like acyl-CoA dehydrogenase
MPKHMVKETREVIAIARKFNEEVAKPLALKLDLLTHEDPDYLPWELVKEANRWGFYTMWVPKLYGGQGYNMPAMSCFSEEVAWKCTGIPNSSPISAFPVKTTRSPARFSGREKTSSS